MDKISLESKKPEDELKIENKIFNFDFQMKEKETAEEYLFRLNQVIEGLNQKNDEFFKKRDTESIILKTKKDYFTEFNQKEYDQVFKKAFRVILENKRKEALDDEKNEEILRKIKFDSNARIYNDDFFSGYIKDKFDSARFFKKTNQERSFFPTKFIKDSLPYSFSLFSVLNIKSEEAKIYLESKLKDKKICLLGGGDSIRDLIENDLIKVSSVINIDPFLDKEEIDKNVNQNYKSYDFKADDKDLIEKLEKEGIAQFDEIWASYSVPFYNTDRQQISNLFDNINALLPPGGNCRITPLNTQNTSCVDEIYQKLTSFVNSGQYNLHLIKNTLIIHKLEIDNSSPKIEFKRDNTEDEERIKMIKKELNIE